MKTRSLLNIFPLMLAALMGSSKVAMPTTSAPNGYIGGGSPIFISGPRKFKGFDRENRRYNSFNKKKR